ncbi:MAG: hypothetical protein O3A01_08630, partial [bacterium]|nr:hypothetical protein [bacterium]
MVTAGVSGVRTDFLAFATAQVGQRNLPINLANMTDANAQKAFLEIAAQIAAKLPCCCDGQVKNEPCKTLLALIKSGSPEGVKLLGENIAFLAKNGGQNEIPTLSELFPSSKGEVLLSRFIQAVGQSTGQFPDAVTQSLQLAADDVKR